MSSLNLSEMENKILAYSWQCFKTGPPDIDYPKLATLVGHSNHKSTANAVASIKKKLAKFAEDNGFSSTADGSAPVSPTKSKAAPTPKKNKSPAKSPAKAKTAIIKTEDGDGDEDGIGGGEGEGEEEEVLPARTTPKRKAAVQKRKYTEDASSEVDNEEEVVERGRSRTITVKTEVSDEDELAEPRTPEPKFAAKVKSKKEGVKSPTKSPAKRVTKKAKMEMAGGKGEGEHDSGVEGGDAVEGEVGGKEVAAGGGEADE